MSDNIKKNNRGLGSNLIEEEESSFQLSDLWSVITDNKWWYVVSVVIAMILAAFYLYRAPKTYSRTEKVIIDEDSQASMMKDLTSFASYSRARYNTGTNVDNEVEALASPDLMEQVVRRLNLETSYTSLQLMRQRELYGDNPFVVAQLGNSLASGFSFVVEKTGDKTILLKDFRVKGKKIGGKVQGAVGDSLVTPVGSLCLYPTLHFDEWKRHDILVSWVSAMARGKGFCSRLTVSLSNKRASVVILNLTDRFPNRAESILSSLQEVHGCL